MVRSTKMLLSGICLDAFALAHGHGILAVRRYDDFVRVVDDAVADGVGNGAAADCAIWLLLRPRLRSLRISR